MFHPTRFQFPVTTLHYCCVLCVLSPAQQAGGSRVGGDPGRGQLLQDAVHCVLPRQSQGESCHEEQQDRSGGGQVCLQDVQPPQAPPRLHYPAERLQEIDTECRQSVSPPSFSSCSSVSSLKSRLLCESTLPTLVGLSVVIGWMWCGFVRGLLKFAFRNSVAAGTVRNMCMRVLCISWLVAFHSTK